MAGQSERSNITHLPSLGPVPSPSQVGPGSGLPPRPQPISAEMEKALIASTCDKSDPRAD
ncbi:unnamed protein product [Brassica oleracea var. botrytis]|uniref:Uncharacterized protein n=1 Tax=Brassica oleracea TaxID=3712 RepID=A0A3P6DHV9_BRAOL|nr:unnamed protein product [Brassica oleracea]